jgi:hypothetical protein
MSDLLIAAMDLSLVKMIRSAMQTADAGAAAALGGGGGGIGPAATYTPTPHFNPRIVLHPTPRFEARKVLHPEARVQFQHQDRLATRGVAPTISSSHSSHSTVNPVWNHLPSVHHSHTACHVKPQILRTDIRNKGSLIDTVI